LADSRKVDKMNTAIFESFTAALVKETLQNLQSGESLKAEDVDVKQAALLCMASNFCEKFGLPDKFGSFIDRMADLVSEPSEDMQKEFAELLLEVPELLSGDAEKLDFAIGIIPRVLAALNLQDN